MDQFTLGTTVVTLKDQMVYDPMTFEPRVGVPAHTVGVVTDILVMDEHYYVKILWAGQKVAMRYAPDVQSLAENCRVLS